MRSSIMWNYIEEEQEVLSRLIQSAQTDEFAEKKARNLRLYIL